MFCLMDKVQDEDKAKAVNNLDYITLALDNVELGFRQFLLDLPLDYHDKDYEDLVKREVEVLRAVFEAYKERVL